MFKLKTYNHLIFRNVFLYLFLILINLFHTFAKIKLVDTVYVRQTLNNFLYEYIFIFNQHSNLAEYQQIIWKDNQISSGFRYIHQRNNQEIITQTLFYGLLDNKWYLFSRETSSFDIDNFLVEKLTEIRKDGEWVQDKRYFFLYNSKKLKEIEYYQKWDGEGWVNLNRKTYTYDDKDSLTVLLSENVINNEWVYDFRFTKKFDNTGNLIENKYEKWSNWKLIDYWKYNYTYYPDNQKETTTYEKLVKESFVPIFKFHYIYDSRNKIKQQTEFYWKDVEWIGKERITNHYDQNSSLLSSMYEKIWNNEWTEYKRITNKYNNQNKIIETFEETFGTQWTPKTKEIYEYDKLGNELLWKKQEIFNDELFDKYKIITNYDEDGFITEIVSLKQDFETWKWDSVNASRPFILKDTLDEHSFYGFYLRATYKTINNADGANSDSSRIYPNPATSFIQIQITLPQTSAFIYDGKGALVKVVHTNDDLSQKIDVSDLVTGAYFILIGNKTHKFIKQ